MVELLVSVAIVGLLASALLPALAAARTRARDVVCLGQIREMHVACQVYLHHNADRYPPAQWPGPPGTWSYWDFTVQLDLAVHPPAATVTPGLLWGSDMTARIAQCPSFPGLSSTPADPYAGYNYNTSYIGHGFGEWIEVPASASHVRRPANCALFGDGQRADDGNANKFMRAPWPNPGDAGFGGRYAGTQGYRHGGTTTNVGFVDGHAEAWAARHTEYDGSGWGPAFADDVGFLSADNDLYDLE